MNELLERARRVADLYFKGKIPNLSYGIAISCTDLTNEQIKRIIALVNLIVFYRYFYKLKDKTFIFELAKYPKVMEYMKEKADAIREERKKMIKERVKETKVSEEELLYTEPDIEELEDFFSDIYKLKKERIAEDPLIIQALTNKKYASDKEKANLYLKLNQIINFIEEDINIIAYKLSELYDAFYKKLREHLTNWPLKLIYTQARIYFPKPISIGEDDICGIFFETAVEELTHKGLIEPDEAYLEVDTNLLRGITPNPDDEIWRVLRQAYDLIRKTKIMKQLKRSFELIKNAIEIKKG